MKHKEITDIVEERFKSINKLSHKILKEFNPNDIHDFRIEVKKLRAFLRMVHATDKKDNAVIPKPLKSFYGYIGIVRNMQLQEHTLFRYMTKCKANEPHEYINVLNKEKKYWQNDAIAFMEDSNFNEAKEKIIKQLPGKIDKEQIQKFIQIKLDELTTAIHSLQDEIEVHNTRKILKDLLYTWNYLHDKSILPKAISAEDDLKSITEILGCFRDICIELEFMIPEYLDKIQNENDKMVLSELQKILKLEKKSIMRKVLYSLNALRDELLNSEILLNS